MALKTLSYCPGDIIIVGSGLAGMLIAKSLLEETPGTSISIVDPESKSQGSDTHFCSQTCAFYINRVGGSMFDTPSVYGIRDFTHFRKPSADENAEVLALKYRANAMLPGLLNDIGVTAKSGRYWVFPDDTSFQSISGELDRANGILSARGLPSMHAETLDAPATREAIPSLPGSQAIHATLYFDDDNFVPAVDLSVGLRAYLGAQNVRFIDATVTDVSTANGQVQQLQSTAGPLQAQTYVFATGSANHPVMNPWTVPCSGYALHSTITPYRTDAMVKVEGAFNTMPLENGGTRFAGVIEFQQEPELSTEKKARLIERAQLTGLRPTLDDTNAWFMGARPVSQDSLPIIGKHPALSNVWVSNGYGPSGALAIPLSKMLAPAILNNTDLPTPQNTLFSPSRFPSHPQMQAKGEQSG